MWNRKEIKNKALKTLKGNIWTLILVGIIMSFVLGEYLITNDGFNNLKILEDFVNTKHEDERIYKFEQQEENYIINKYADKILFQVLFGNTSEQINKFNKEHNISKGIFYDVVQTITKKQTQLQNSINAVVTNFDESKADQIKLFIISLLGILIKIFLINPLKIGESRIFLESSNYKKTRIKRLLYSYKKKRYWSSVKVVFINTLYKLLWNLTIIGGFIKTYSYKMITFIAAENPNIKPNDVIKMSKEMMNGNKLQAFKMDLSFLGWFILQYITFGIAGIIVTPYYKAIYTELYKELREDYIKNKKYNYELLNDEKLFEENELDKYPEISKNKAKRKEYTANYDITSIILFFFTFSIVGWLWEVGLYLFRDGVFVNRGSFYGPWLPIYGAGCTILILLTKFRFVKKILKNPFVAFLSNTLLCTTIEYITSLLLEVVRGLKYWDYTGVFLNINGRVCLECSLFFGIGGCLCVYVIAPFLEKYFSKMSKKFKIGLCIYLLLIFAGDTIYSLKYPHIGEGITIEKEISE